MFSWCCCCTKLSGTGSEMQLSLNLVHQYPSIAVQTSPQDTSPSFDAPSLQGGRTQQPQFQSLWHDDEERWLHCQFTSWTDSGVMKICSPEEQDPDFSESTDCPLEDSDESQDHQICITGSAKDEQDWWIQADPESVQGCVSLAKPAKLLRAEVVKFDATASEQQLLSLYDELGAHAPTGSYVAVWLKLNDVSLVLLSELPDGMASQVVGYPDLVMGRLKLILNPVKVKLPLPAKGPKDADTVGSFFGKGATLTGLTKATSGADIAFIQIDLYSKWMMRLALQQVGFRLENTLELVLVDWPGQCVLSSIRLMVTQSFLDCLL